MQKAVLVLLSATSLLIAATVGALFWRAGAGWAPASSALIGTLGLAFGLHSMIGRGVLSSRLRREFEALRQ